MKSYTCFVVPFSFHREEWKDIHSKLTKWQPSTNVFSTSNVLYPYIRNLFGSDSMQKPVFEVLEFKGNALGVNSDLFVERILGKKSIAVIAENAGARSNPKTIPFTLCASGNYAPHLFVSPTAQVGIMTFTVELETTSSNDLMTLNYHLHKRNETSHYQCVCMFPENQDDTRARQCFSDILSQKTLWVSDGDKKRMGQGNTRKNADYVVWNLNDFVNVVLATFGTAKNREPRIEYFCEERLQLFTFCSIDDSQDLISSEEALKESLRLARCVIEKYMLPFNQLIEQGATLQTYENVYFSCAVEGVSMICLGKANNQEFFAQMHNKFINGYLPVYVLALIQRYTLLNLERRLTEFTPSEQGSDDALWEMIDRFSRIKASCYFTDVSVFTHYSQFYQHCCRNLHVQETFDEVDEKIRLMKLGTDKALQDVVESTENKQRFLNFVVAMLTVAQVIQASFEIINNRNTKAMWVSIGVGVVGVIVLIGLMWCDIKKLFKRNKRRK